MTPPMEPPSPRRTRPWWWRLTRSTLFIYGAVSIFVFFASESMMFVPPSSDAPDPHRWVRTKDGTAIAFHLVRPAQPAPAVILLSHGNAEDLSTVGPEVGDLARQLGIAVASYDYPGYGVSAGRPTEKGAVAAIRAAYQELITTEGFRPEQVLLYGRSIGSGPTVALAEETPVAGMILENAFVSAYRVVTGLPIFPFDRFPNLRRIRNVSVPTLFFVSAEDRIIAPWHTDKLHAASAATDKTRVRVDGAGHNNLSHVLGSQYWDTIREFARKVESK
ncbi:MAG: alpha/beta hydrolase [Planctomycetota bacterium]